MYFTGLRINEAAPITEEMLEEFIRDGRFSFYQPKINKHRLIRFNSVGTSVIKTVYEQNKDIIFKYHSQPFPPPLSKRYNN